MVGDAGTRKFAALLLYRQPAFCRELRRLRVMIFILLLHVSFGHAQAHFQVVGALKPIVAVQGDSVVLSCHVEPQLDVSKSTVEWSRPDLHPDPNDRLKEVEYVCVYRNSVQLTDLQMSLFIGRTALFTDGLGHGNISLKIDNVTFADQGPYKCFLPKLAGQLQYSIVYLVVVPDSVKNSMTALPPRNLQTLDPTKETTLKDGLSTRNQLISVVVIGGVLIVFLVVIMYLTHRFRKLKLTDNL